MTDLYHMTTFSYHIGGIQGNLKPCVIIPLFA